jgi:hypothetical protein
VGEEQDADGHGAKLADARDLPEAVAGHVRFRPGFTHASPGTRRFPSPGAIGMKPSQSIALSALAAAWLAAMPAQAATQYRLLSTPAARLCTLSIPTTDTGVRPKATGFRNEGTTNAFVICAFDSSPWQIGYADYESTDDPELVELYFASIDGKNHAFNCTGVNSWPSSGTVVPMQYVVKTGSVSSTGSSASVSWRPADFGGAANIPTSGSFSVTCLLPPGVSILIGDFLVEEIVGS